MKILHTADIHIGTDTFGRLDPATGLSTRLMDFQRAFEFTVQTAIDEDVDLFLFAGDAYRTADPTPTQQRVFAECLRPLVAAGIPVAMVVGNHDHPVSFGKASALDIFGYLAGVVHVFNRPSRAPEIIETKSGPLQIIAMPWPVRSVLLSKEEHRGKSPLEIRELIETRYAEIVRSVAELCDPALPTILAGHFSVLGAELGGSERTSLIAHEPKFLASQLAVPPVDYVALGHIHRHQNLNAGGVPVVYASSIERVSFKEIDDDKGFVVVELDAARAPGHRFVPPVHPHPVTGVDFRATPARRFVSVSVDARASADPTGMILDAIARKDVTDAVARVRYVVDEAQAPLVDARRIREALKPAYAVAAIERTVEAVERQRRTVVTREASLRDALERYVAQRDDLGAIRERLIDAGLALEAELDGETRETEVGAGDPA